MKEIETSVKETLAARTAGTAGDMTDEKRLRDDLGLDSLDTVELAMALEDDLHIEILDEHLEGVDTVGDLVRTVRKLTEDA